jgi:hypothetical protein
VTSQMVAAVVTPLTFLSCLIITPAPMKPIPDRMPSGSRIMSSCTNEVGALPDMSTSRLTSNMDNVAARHTSIVVRVPAG